MDRDPIYDLPEFLQNPDEKDRLDELFDVVAANTRWSNVDVARAVCRLLRYIADTNASQVNG